jgi:hypothetical protein
MEASSDALVGKQLLKTACGQENEGNLRMQDDSNTEKLLGMNSKPLDIIRHM